MNGVFIVPIDFSGTLNRRTETHHLHGLSQVEEPVCHEILASLTTSFRRELAQIIARILTSNGNESFSLVGHICLERQSNSQKMCFIDPFDIFTISKFQKVWTSKNSGITYFLLVKLTYICLNNLLLRLPSFTRIYFRLISRFFFSFAYDKLCYEIKIF